jgi:hypothetical protein
MENAAAHLPVLAKLGIGHVDVALAVANGALTHLALMNEVTHRTAPLKASPMSEVRNLADVVRQQTCSDVGISLVGILSRTFGLRTIALSA